MNSTNQVAGKFTLSRALVLVFAIVLVSSGTTFGQACAECDTIDSGCEVVDGGNTSRCGMPAPQYPVPFATPRPTTPTNFTYPPMMPHNSLPHYRNIYSYRHADGLSRTNVHWHSQPFMSGVRRLHNILEFAR